MSSSPLLSGPGTASPSMSSSQPPSCSETASPSPVPAAATARQQNRVSASEGNVSPPSPPDGPSSSRTRRPAKHHRSPSPPESPVLALAPQASSTMREEVDPDRSRPKIVLHIKNAGAISKPPKKKAKQPSDIVITCNYCGEAVSSIDIKSKKCPCALWRS